MNNPYSAPEARVMESGEVEYVGFWPRVLASVVDSILMIAVIYPVLYALYGADYFSDTAFVAGPADILLNYVFPAVAVILFWIYKSATPGKMMVKARIVDAKTGGRPSGGRLIGRYFAYYLSMIPLFLGFVWVAFDSRKQGWHDKLAGTLVVRDSTGPGGKKG